MINKACFGITEQMADLHFHFFGWSDILTSGLIGGLDGRRKRLSRAETFGQGN